MIHQQTAVSPAEQCIITWVCIECLHNVVLKKQLGLFYLQPAEESVAVDRLCGYRGIAFPDNCPVLRWSSTQTGLETSPTWGNHADARYKAVRCTHWSRLCLKLHPEKKRKEKTRLRLSASIQWEAQNYTELPSSNTHTMRDMDMATTIALARCNASCAIVMSQPCHKLCLNWSRGNQGYNTLSALYDSAAALQCSAKMQAHDGRSSMPDCQGGLAFAQWVNIDTTSEWWGSVKTQSFCVFLSWQEQHLLTQALLTHSGATAVALHRGLHVPIFTAFWSR